MVAPPVYKDKQNMRSKLNQTSFVSMSLQIKKLLEFQSSKPNTQVSEQKNEDRFEDLTGSDSKHPAIQIHVGEQPSSCPIAIPSST